MKTALFDYLLPSSFIAQQPAEPRDSSRLLVLHRDPTRRRPRIEHRVFREIGEYLRPGDLLVANNSRVIPARLRGRKSTGGNVELLLLRKLDDPGQIWECLVRGRNITAGTKIVLARDKDYPDAKHPRQVSVDATVLAVLESGVRTVQFTPPVGPYLDELGEIPLPPYITDYTGERERYQTVYSLPEGSAAAPTAGLHFTPELLAVLSQQGVHFDTVTLHVGLDTFQPVVTEEIEEHSIHSEWAELTAETSQRINETKLAGGRVVSVGTTTTRTLEWAATPSLPPQDVESRAAVALPPQHGEGWGGVTAFAGAVDLFIRPGYRFRAVDALITNFHLPRSSLLMLVSAFVGHAYGDDADAGRRILLEAYDEAMRHDYRFYSFGDAMLIL